MKVGEIDMSISHPRKVVGTLLHGGFSYKDKWYLIKWPHNPSLLSKMSHRTHRVRVEWGLEQQNKHRASLQTGQRHCVAGTDSC